MEGNQSGNTPQIDPSQTTPAQAGTAPSVPPQATQNPAGTPPPPVTPPQTVTEPSATPPPAKKGFPKIILLAVIVIILAVILGGLYFMIGNISPAPQGSAKANISTPAPTQAAGDDITTNAAPTPVEELLSYSSEQIEGLSLYAYTVAYPASWTLDEEATDITHAATITKGNYSITINQAPTGGNFCVFEGELPDGPATDYRNSEYVEIDAEFGLLRRAGEDGSYSFCEQNADEPDNFFLPTSIGFITYETPADADEEILLEMDEIVKSITTE